MYVCRNAARIAIVTLVVMGAKFALAAEAHAVQTEFGVEAKMRDGTVLRADIYRPIGDGKFPVLLQRTPYDKRNEAEFGIKAAARGYVVIVQDVRGRYSSDGDWYPFKNEPNDGYDTVEWAATLPYSNGKVGMFGGSYVGATQMLAAVAHPPHLTAICPVVTASNYHDGWTYQGGAFEQWFNESWTSGLAQDSLSRMIERNTNAMNNIWKSPLTEYKLFDIPNSTSDSGLIHTLAPYYADWLAHPEYDAYWKQFSIEEHYPEIQVPIFTVAAWYDIFLGGSLRNYMGVKSHGGTEAARKGQRLLVVIGGHAGGGRKVGDVDFGAAAPFQEDDFLNDMILSWYDFQLKGMSNDFAKSKAVRLFVMGVNQWRDEDDWPLARAKETKYYLHSAGKANTTGGDGTLNTNVGKAEPADRYTYDPANPAPTVGGPLCCDAKHLKPGPRDQRAVEAREDVLVYSTPVLTNDMEVTGPVKMELFASSSVVDTDFLAKLVDVWPDGFAQNLTEGIVRARYRDSQEHASLMNPNQIYKFSIDMWATSNVFKKGHRVRLEISSSNFPRFDRNMNNGEDSAAGRKAIPATNVIYHDAEHPSVLIVPVVGQ
jgi:putative CocE/NonD family hydrolase